MSSSFLQKKNKNSRKSRRVRSERPSRSLTVDTVYRFRRMSAVEIGLNSFLGFTSTNGAIIYGKGLAFAFSLNTTYINGSAGSNIQVNLPHAAEFVALFDRFKIDSVTIRMVPSSNVTNTTTAAIGSAPGTGLPIVQTSVDFDDATPPSSQGDLLERTDCKILRFDKEVVFTVKPRTGIVVQTTASSGAAAQGQGMWLDTTGNGQDASWFGRKFWSEELGSAPGVQTTLLMIYLEYNLSFATPR